MVDIISIRRRVRLLESQRDHKQCLAFLRTRYTDAADNATRSAIIAEAAWVYYSLSTFEKAKELARVALRRPGTDQHTRASLIRLLGRIKPVSEYKARIRQARKIARCRKPLSSDQIRLLDQGKKPW